MSGKSLNVLKQILFNDILQNAQSKMLLLIWNYFAFSRIVVLRNKGSDLKPTMKYAQQSENVRKQKYSYFLKVKFFL